MTGSQELFEQLSAYVDGELSESEAAACERALFRDEESRGVYRELRVLHQVTLVEPTPEPLPIKLDLALTGMAEAFLAADSSEETAAPAPLEAVAHVNDDEEDAERELQMAFEWLHRMRWRIALVATVLFSTLSGMSYLAYRDGGVPSLSRSAQRVSALPELGNELLHKHVAFAHPHEPDYDGHTLEFLFKRQVPHAVPIPAEPFGVPVDGRVRTLDDEPLPIVRYNDPSGPVSLFVLPTARAIEAFGDIAVDDLGREEALKTCLVPARERCFSGANDNSLCVQHLGDVTHVWVASLPEVELKARIIASPSATR